MAMAQFLHVGLIHPDTLSVSSASLVQKDTREFIKLSVYKSLAHSNDALRKNTNLSVRVAAFRLREVPGQCGKREDMNNQGEGKARQTCLLGGGGLLDAAGSTLDKKDSSAENN